MANDYKNPEGYPDPTAFKAVRAASRVYRPIVYICSPYSGDVQENVRKAKKYSRFAVDKGYIPLTPHLMLPQFMSEDERALALFMDSVFVTKCEQLWVFGENITDGMQGEIARAEKRGMVIRRFTDDLKEET